MEVVDRLGAEHLVRVAIGYRDALRTHQESLNRLNVYPVPDGDTGTNMALTLEAVVAELDGATGMTAVCRAISHGSLMGARGNSGVILSQLLRGLTRTLGDADDAEEGAGGATIAEALREASGAAYQAVMHPVEGTILTVAREAAEAASATPEGTLVDVLDAAAGAARDALARTPDLLPVLAEAGVVDAGGAGFVLLLDVMLDVVAGRPVPAPDHVPAADAPVATASGSDSRGHGQGTGDGGPRYEVMYLLDGPDEAVDGLKDAWGALGDSIVVVGGDGTWNCHVHTDDIGAAVEAGIAAGRPHRIRVTDLHEQVVDERCRRSQPVGEGQDAEGQGAEAETPVATAVVAVAAGDGIGRILRSLGVHRVVAGGQSMNPSTAEILAAVESAPGKEIVVLPNNKNVVAVAEQAATAASRPVQVVPTKSVTEAFGALLAYDPDADSERNGEAMAAAAAAVVTGEVTRAVRDATTSAGAVKSGDWLGVTADGIVVAAAEPTDAAFALLDRLVCEGHEIVTVVRGEGATVDDTDRITDWLGRHCPDLSVEVHDGGQPLAAWLFSVE